MNHLRCLVALLSSLLLWSACQPPAGSVTPPAESALLLPKVAGFPRDGAGELSWGWLWWGSNQPDEPARPDAFRILMGGASGESMQEIALVNGEQTTFRVSELVNRQMYTFAIEALVDNQSAVRSNLIAVAPGKWVDPQPVLDQVNSSCYWGSWSPDGQSIAFVGPHPQEAGGAAVFTHHLAERKTQFRSSGTQPHWQLRGDQIIFVTDLVLNRASSDTLPTYLGLLSGNQTSTYLGGDGSYLQPVWSSDGRRLAFLANLGQGRYDLYQCVFSATPTPLPLTKGFADLAELSDPLDRSPQHPTWHPEGDWIAYDRFSAKTSPAPTFARDIYRVSSQGEMREEPLVMSHWEDHTPAYSPDGQKLAYLSDRSGVPGIWLLDLQRGLSRQVYGGTSPTVDVRQGRLAWSPQGDRLLFNGSMNDSVSTLFVLRVDR